MEEKEIWKTIADYPRYEISNLGKVRDTSNGHILKQCLDLKGYPSVNLNDGERATLKVVHRYVAMAFLPNPQDKPCVDHIDTNRTNNIVILNEDGSINLEKTNLRWVTHNENINNPLSLGKMHDAFADKEFLKSRVLAKVGKGEKNEPRHVYAYTKDGAFVKDYISINDAAKQMGVDYYAIYAAVDSPTRTACGYKWHSKKRIEPTQ